jgi:hypothetical protein
MPASDGGDDFVGIGDPMEGFGLSVVIDQEAIDGFLKVGDGSEDAALEATLGQDGEEALDRVEPRGRGRREVEGPARMAGQPLAHELRRKLGDGGEEGGVTGLVIKPPEPPRWSVTP